MKTFLAILGGQAAALALALGGLYVAAESPAPQIVTRVVDADTVRIGRERIRLLDVDCPERNAPGGAAATELMRALVHGHPVTVQRHGRDRYGRTLARLYLGSTHVGCLLVTAGRCTWRPGYPTLERCAP